MPPCHSQSPATTACQASAGRHRQGIRSAPNYWRFTAIQQRSPHPTSKVSLDIRPAVLLAEFLNHGLHRVRLSDRLCFELRVRAPRINPNLRVLEDIPIPLRIGAVDWQELELFAFRNEPDRIADDLAGFPADNAQPNLAIPRGGLSSSLFATVDSGAGSHVQHPTMTIWDHPAFPSNRSSHCSHCEYSVLR